MELLAPLATMLVATSFLLMSPCASHQLNLQKSLAKVDDHGIKFTVPSLPRKLQLNEEATVESSSVEKNKFVVPQNKFIKPTSGTKQQKKEENVVHGTRKERVDEDNSEYFNMDYGWVKKRRPIHNKQIPFTP